MAFRIAVLASGRGSNLQAIIDAIADGRLAAELVGVFSDKPSAYALERARVIGVPAVVVRPRDFPSRAASDEYLFSQVDAVAADLIVCAGYMRLLSSREVSARQGHIINIHPSLLPAFKGLRTHQQALEAGAREHGASVHYVTPELDGGPVIAQARVAVDPADPRIAYVTFSGLKWRDPQPHVFRTATDAVPGGPQRHLQCSSLLNSKALPGSVHAGRGPRKDTQNPVPRVSRGGSLHSHYPLGRATTVFNCTSSTSLRGGRGRWTRVRRRSRAG